MRPSTIVLGVGATAVAAGGLYLLLSLSGADREPTPEQALAAAQARDDAAGDPGSPENRDRRAARARPPRAQPRDPHATYDPDVAGRAPAPQRDFRRNPGAPALDLPEKLRSGDLLDPPLEHSPEHSEQLLEANKLYDRGDFDGARALAKKMLDRVPGNVKMLRVIVSSACILGDADEAAKFAVQLSGQDHDAMVNRCAKYDIQLPPKPKS